MTTPGVVVEGSVRVDGLEVGYRLEGPASGAVLMFGNSLMADYSMWDGNVAAFTDRYRVLRYDMRGHGKTGVTPGACTTGLLAQDAVQLLDALGIECVHYVGLSLGGMVAQQLGKLYPRRLHSLSLCDTSSDTSAMRSGWDERIDTVRSTGIGAIVEGTLQRWFTPAFLAREPALAQSVRSMLGRMNPEGYINCACAVRDLAHSSVLASIKTPTLVLVGRDDPALTIEHARILHAGIPGAAATELVVIEDAAHLPNIEQRQKFNAAIRHFIDDVRCCTARQP